MRTPVALATALPMAAGVAFTAHPITGDRDQTVVTAVAGLGDPLVSGEAVGSEAEPDLQRRQLLLDAVVKVLGKTLSLCIRRRKYIARRTPSP